MEARYNAKEVEAKIARFWEQSGVYKYDPKSKKPAFSIDTPPPTVSGFIHIGHVYSYSQADFMARYKRMRGFNVFYPFGYDNNGLPTEILVEKNHNIVSESLGREKFNALVEEEVKKYAKLYREIWGRVGISVEWDMLYTTISERVQRISQYSFIELYKMGRAYRKETPTMWCPKDKTAVSQMELKDATLKSKFVNIRFSKEIEIATTRPELLPSCVAIFVNPTDAKNKKLIGKTVKVPIFGQEVKVLADSKVDPSKGTGVVMCCTFGDQTDIAWFKEYNLPLKLSIDENGAMLVEPFRGMKLKEARAKMIEKLRSEGFLVGEKEIEHPVNVHERCNTEIEFLVKKQWFIKYLDLKEQFLKMGEELQWHPEFMKVRYDNWVKGLGWDWGISRQRFYGVPFPVWYCKKCSEVKLAITGELPVNPLASMPKTSCEKCGSKDFEPETDVMDTWATSSLTPLINAGWDVGKKVNDRLYPMDLRPQAHDIISFWLFTSVVKGYLHTGKLPFKNALILGHALDPKGESIHKSKGNVIEPVPIMDKFGADALRHWASLSAAGSDSNYSEKEVDRGARQVNKLWNVAKFIEMKGTSEDGRPTNIIDKWILSKLMLLVKDTTELLDGYNYAEAKRRIDAFFWFFADNYIEFVKHRIYAGADESAGFTLKKALLTLLKLYAPYAPYVTEEIYASMFRKDGAPVSIHVSEWPEFEKGLYNEDVVLVGDEIQAIVAYIRQWKHNQSLALNAPLREAVLSRVPKGSEKELMGIMNIGRITEGKGENAIEGTDITISLSA